MPGTGQRIRFQDGTTIEGGGVGYSDGRLWCYFNGYTMAEAAALFFDENKTEVIVFEYGEMSDRYEGYTICKVLSTDRDGNISVCMVREVE